MWVSRIELGFTRRAVCALYYCATSLVLFSFFKLSVTRGAINTHVQVLMWARTVFLCYICWRRMTEPCRYVLASWRFPGHFRTIIPNFIFPLTMCEYQFSHILFTAILACMKWCLRFCFHFPGREKCWLLFYRLVWHHLYIFFRAISV